MKKLIYTTIVCLFIGLFCVLSCKNKEPKQQVVQPNTESVVDELKISHKEQPDKEKKFADSVARRREWDSIHTAIKVNIAIYIDSVAKLNHFNGYKNIAQYNATVDSLPLIDLPLGNYKSFFYEYPDYWEIFAFRSYDEENFQEYLRDSIADTMFVKARSIVTNHKFVPYNKDNKFMELFIDSTFLYNKTGSALQFRGVLKQTKTYNVLLYSPILSNNRNVSSIDDAIMAITINNTTGKVIDVLTLEGNCQLPPDYEPNFITSLFYIDDTTFYIKEFIKFSRAELTCFISLQQYVIDNGGHFIRYFKTANSLAYKELYDPESYPNYVVYAKGAIKNHKQHGNWEEVTMRYISKNRRWLLKQPLFVESYYQSGLREGTWKYYALKDADSLTRDNFHIEKEQMLMEETYKNGQLIDKVFY